MTPSCTVIICTRDRPDALERCLTAVQRSSYPRFSVLVVDSAPWRDAARSIVRRFNAGYLQLAAPGLSHARNQGALASSSEFVAYLDDDAVPSPEWLSELLTGFSEPRVDAVTGRILPLRVESQAERMSALADPFAGRNFRVVFDQSVPNWFEVASFGGVGLGSNMAFRRSVFDKWSGFDERLGRGAPLVGGEDVYAFSQLISAGSAVVYVPTAVVQHPYPTSMEELRHQRYQEVKSAAAYFVMLIAEEKKHRAAVLRVITRGIFKRLRNRADLQRQPFRSALGWWMLVKAITAGVLGYGYLRMSRRSLRSATVLSDPSHSHPCAPAAEHTPGPRAR